MYPGIGKDLIMIIIGGLGWDLLKDFGRNFEREIMPLLPGLIPSLPPTPRAIIPGRRPPHLRPYDIHQAIIHGATQVLPLPVLTRWFLT